jgi:PAS domain S-box-containing protein
MITPSQADGKWTERTSAATCFDRHADSMFELLFDQSADAIWLLDPETRRFIDCNQAALRLMRADNKPDLLRVASSAIADTASGKSCLPHCSSQSLTKDASPGSRCHFEWTLRRCDGTELPLEVAATPIPVGDRTVQVLVCRDLSERKLAETEIWKLNESLERRIAERTAELSASEARFRTMLEHAPEAIVVFDANTGCFRYGNKHASELYGYTLAELTRLGPADVSPDFQPCGRRSAELAREKLQEACAGGTPVFEWIHRHSSGRLIPSEVRLVRLPAQGERLVQASIINNSERRRREKVQQATYEISEAVHITGDLDSLFRRIHHIVKGLMPAENLYLALYDPQTELLTFAYHVDEVTPRPDPCPLGTGLTGYVFRLGKPLLVDQAMNAKKRRENNTITFEGYEGIRYVESGIAAAIWLGVPLSTGGRPFGVLAVQDYHNPEAYGETEKQLLTFVAVQVALAIERKRVQQALRDSEAMFRALFRASSQGVILHDESQYLEVNPAAVRMLGYKTAEELQGKGPWDTSPPFQPGGESSDALAARYIAECVRKGSVRFDWVARTAQGQELPLEVILTRIDWGGRQIIQAVLNDITARKNAERELLNSLAREKELGQLRSNFVSMVSHEFRTPLGVILSSAEILESYFEQLEPCQRREQLLSIQKNTRRMSMLMEEVLLLGMAEAGKLDFRPVLLDLGQLSRRLIEEVSSATNRTCSIELRLSGFDDAAFGDERLLRHIFSNLLSNAVKYSVGEAPVDFEIMKEGCYAICRVRDRGLGIPEQDVEWLFSAFHRGRNVGHLPGSGLGLIIVKRCLELHGGDIRVDSKVGFGTTVTVRLPLFVPAPDQESPKRESVAEFSV